MSDYTFKVIQSVSFHLKNRRTILEKNYPKWRCLLVNSFSIKHLAKYPPTSPGSCLQVEALFTLLMAINTMSMGFFVFALFIAQEQP